MRVLLIVADGKPGGGTTHVLQILQGLRHAVSFHLITEQDSYLMREVTALGISCHGLQFFISRFNVLLPFQLRKIVSVIQPDLVHLHGGRAGFFFVLSFLKVPMVYTIHGFHFVGKPLIHRWMAMLVERLIIQRSNCAMFVSGYDLELAEKYHLVAEDALCAVIHPGLSCNDLPRAFPNSLRHIGFVGRLEYQKDPLLFLEMIEFLPEYSATVVGGGTLEPSMKQTIENRGLGERVRMVGQLSHQEALKILATLGAIILPSRWEGLPILVLEAMGIGVPVISMKVSGLEEIIRNGINGMLVERRSGEDLAKQVERVTKDEVLRASIIETAKKTVQGQFSMEKMLASILNIYKEHSISHLTPLRGK